ncbi:MAG: RNA-binding S4 domain-containing protein [Candidatus Marinimicrobia bacterium]|nr:RNA-binding S4 domain-containing protein [Candidatus Neomarinimicrobiota bacterium]
MEQKIYINTPFIKLGSLLKLANMGGSGGLAKMIIQDGQVRLNGKVCTMRGKKILAHDVIEIDMRPTTYTIEVLQKEN